MLTNAGGEPTDDARAVEPASQHRRNPAPRRVSWSSSQVMSCPDANTIVAFVDGHLSEAERSRVAVHLDSCEACFALVGAAVHGESGSDEQSGRIAKPLLSKGAEIGRYLILDLVGKGVMGEVYSAYDPQLDRKVALKLLHEEPHRGRRHARFSREAQAIARLSHPNVVVSTTRATSASGSI